MSERMNRDQNTEDRSTEQFHIQLVDAKHMVGRLCAVFESHGCPILALEREGDEILTTLHVTIRASETAETDFHMLLSDIVGVQSVCGNLKPTHH